MRLIRAAKASRSSSDADAAGMRRRGSVPGAGGAIAVPPTPLCELTKVNISKHRGRSRAIGQPPGPAAAPFLHGTKAINGTCLAFLGFRVGFHWLLRTAGVEARLPGRSFTKHR